jgi:Cu2+-exporting ATPase
MTAQPRPSDLAGQTLEAAPATLTLAVEEMHCGGCLRSVERAALRVSGVDSARASLAAKRVTVTYDPVQAGEVDVIAALDRIGFTAAPVDAEGQGRGDARQKYLLRRVAVAGFAAMNIMLLSIAVWSGEGGDMNPALAGMFRWLSALIALPTVAYAGQPFFQSALAALKGRRLNMDVPISLAIILATGMSLYQTILGSEQIYFDAAVALLFFLLIGRYLDESLRVRARGEAQNLLSLQGGIATVIDADGTQRKVAAHALRPGDLLLVASGERVVADGLVRAGHGQVDQSLITGETAPANVNTGDPVYAGTLNLAQVLQVEVSAADDATLLAEISRLMLTAEQGKARYRRLADRAAQIYAPAVHILGAVTFIGWLAAGAGWQTALTYAIAVLIITCPCALALAVPAVQIAAASRLFRRGVMLKAPDGLERIAEIDLVVFDKTGTLTLGKAQLINREEISDTDLAAAAALAATSKHP